MNVSSTKRIRIRICIGESITTKTNTIISTHTDTSTGMHTNNAFKQTK